MTDVRMKAEMQGQRDGEDWPKPGQIKKGLPAEEAELLIKAGIAEALPLAEKATEAVRGTR